MVAWLPSGPLSICTLFWGQGQGQTPPQYEWLEGSYLSGMRAERTPKGPILCVLALALGGQASKAQNSYTSPITSKPGHLAVAQGLHLVCPEAGT